MQEGKLRNLLQVAMVYLTPGMTPPSQEELQALWASVDALVPCDHRRVLELEAGLAWCDLCGAIRIGADLWRSPRG